MNPDDVAVDLLANALSSGTFEYLNDEGKDKVRAGARQLLDQIDNARTRNAMTLRDLVDPTLAHEAVEGVFRREDISGGRKSVGWWAARAVLDLPATVPSEREPVGWVSLHVEDGRIGGGQFPVGAAHRDQADEFTRAHTLPGDPNYFRTYKIVEA